MFSLKHAKSLQLTLPAQLEPYNLNLPLSDRKYYKVYSALQLLQLTCVQSVYFTRSAIKQCFPLSVHGKVKARVSTSCGKSPSAFNSFSLFATVSLSVGLTRLFSKEFNSRSKRKASIIESLTPSTGLSRWVQTRAKVFSTMSEFFLNSIRPVWSLSCGKHLVKRWYHDVRSLNEWYWCSGILQSLTTIWNNHSTIIYPSVPFSLSISARSTVWQSSSTLAQVNNPLNKLRCPSETPSRNAAKWLEFLEVLSSKSVVGTMRKFPREISLPWPEK